MPEHFPSILFVTVSALCAALALAEWGARRRLAAVAAAIAAFAAICFAANHAWSRYSIRVDLLLTIPSVSLAALVVGVFAIGRPPALVQALGAALGLIGAVSLLWFAYAMHRSALEDARTMALFNEGDRLFWSETIRCQENFEKRFGPMDRHDDPCMGNLVVKSRSPNAYPFTRVVLNDRGDAQLLFSPKNGMERPVSVSRSTFALMKRASSGEWLGKGDSGFGPTQISLAPRELHECEAKIEHQGTTSVLSTQRTELPNCQPPANPTVTFMGAWGDISTDPSGTRRLLQIWLWSENSGTGRGVLLNDIASSGLHRDFVFLKHFRAVRVDGGSWRLLLEKPDVSAPTTLSMTIDGHKARVSGPQAFTGPSGETVLEQKEVVTDARIEMVPVRDTALFERYLDSSLFNLDLSWTAP